MCWFVNWWTFTFRVVCRGGNLRRARSLKTFNAVRVRSKTESTWAKTRHGTSNTLTSSAHKNILCTSNIHTHTYTYILVHYHKHSHSIQLTPLQIACVSINALALCLYIHSFDLVCWAENGGRLMIVNTFVKCFWSVFARSGQLRLWFVQNQMQSLSAPRRHKAYVCLSGV